MRFISALSLVLAIATTASAECAWVLWIDTLSSVSASSTRPLRAYKTKAECDDALTAAVDSFTGSPVVLKRRQEVYVTGGKSTTVHRDVCLPDTIDPRGPEARPDGRLTAPGHYECKWTLWIDEFVVYGQQRHGTPKRYGTYADDAACKVAQHSAPKTRDTEDRLRRMAHDMTFADSRAAHSVLFMGSGENAEALLLSPPSDNGVSSVLAGATFQCLPDTVDPRGAKGK